MSTPEGARPAPAVPARGPGASATVTRWGELRGEHHVPGVVLRVLVAGEHAGMIEHSSDGWAAYCSPGLTRPAALRYRVTEHATADEAVRAVLRSGWARRLGGRAASRVNWSDRASRAAGRLGTR
jgi:hypothetical protein